MVFKSHAVPGGVPHFRRNKRARGAAAGAGLTVAVAIAIGAGCSTSAPAGGEAIGTRGQQIRVVEEDAEAINADAGAVVDAGAKDTGPDAQDAGPIQCSNAADNSCLQQALAKAQQLLMANGNCFANALAAIGGGGGCSSASLTSCIQTVLSSATFVCGPYAAGGANGSASASGACLDQKAAQNAACAAGNCLPSGAGGCGACANSSSTITVYPLTGGDPGTIAQNYCGYAPNIGALAALLVHEAGHSCVGTHSITGNCLQYGAGGVATTACGALDPTEMGTIFAQCNGAPVPPLDGNPLPLCPNPTAPPTKPCPEAGVADAGVIEASVQEDIEEFESPTVVQ
jgi:hypothetical protein